MSERPARAHYPVFLDVAGRLCAVIGASPAAERKARALARLGADVVVFAPDVSDELAQMEVDGSLGIERRAYVRGDLDGAFLALCDSGSAEVDRAVFEEAEERGCLVNVIGDPSLCNYVVPASVRRGALQIAVSTGGFVPELARSVRSGIAEDFGQEWSAYVTLLAEVRSIAIARDSADAGLIDRIIASDLRERLTSGPEPSAEAIYEEFALPETAQPDRDDGSATAEESS